MQDNAMNKCSENVLKCQEFSALFKHILSVRVIAFMLWVRNFPLTEMIAYLQTNL